MGFLQLALPACMVFGRVQTLVYRGLLPRPIEALLYMQSRKSARLPQHKLSPLHSLKQLLPRHRLRKRLLNRGLKLQRKPLLGFLIR